MQFFYEEGIPMQNHYASSENQEFAAFCVLRAEIGGHKVYDESLMTSILTTNGVPYRPPVDGSGSSRKVTRGPLQVGEVVKVLGRKCTHELNSNNCRNRKLAFSQDNPKYFVITDIRGDSSRDSKGYPVFVLQGLVTYQEEMHPDNQARGNSMKLEGELDSSANYIFHAVPPSKGTKTILTKIEKQMSYMASGSKRYNEGTLNSLKEELASKALEPHDGHGLYRAGYRSLEHFQKSLAKFRKAQQFEIVYKRGLENEVPEYRAGFVDMYSDAMELAEAIQNEELEVDQLLDDDSLRRYGMMHYQAPIPYFGDTKKGEKFAQVDTRITRGTYATINPNVGKIYYIGKVGQRPNGWKDALKDLLSEQAEDLL